MSENIHSAYRERDAKKSASAHASRGHERHPTQGEYLSDFVLGGTDGIITTFAVVAGVAGAELSTGLVLVLGAANLLADGLSMAAGNYLGATSEREYYRRERAREEWEVENVPDHEVDEIREIYQQKGFRGELLEKIVSHITADKKLWVDTMMREELGIIEDRKRPLLAASATFAAFIVFGAVPLLVYLLAWVSGGGSGGLFPYCVAMTGVALFIVGALRSSFTERGRFRSGVEILIVGGLAGAISFGVGALLKGIVE